MSGQADVVIAGGSETFSDVPIRYPRSMRKKLLQVSKIAKKGPVALAQWALKNIRLKDFTPEAPAIQNFHTNEIMGHSSDRLASRFGVSREEQDAYALDSHQKAAKAHAEGKYNDEVVLFRGSREENGIIGDSTLEKYASLKPGRSMDVLNAHYR